MNNEPWYDAHNSIACCKICNSMKSNQTFHDFLVRTQSIAGRLGESIACNGE